MHYEGYKICSNILKERNAKLKSEAEETQRLKAAEEKERLSDFALEKKMARAEKQAQSNLEEVSQRQQILDKEHRWIILFSFVIHFEFWNKIEFECKNKGDNYGFLLSLIIYFGMNHSERGGKLDIFDNFPISSSQLFRPYLFGTSYNNFHPTLNEDQKVLP